MKSLNRSFLLGFITLLALACSHFDRDGHGRSDHKTPDATNEDPDATNEDGSLNVGGSGSLVGNALIDNGAILSVELEGHYIGVKDDKLYNFDQNKKIGTSLKGLVKVDDKSQEVELPQRPQNVVNLSSDLFLLLRESKKDKQFIADAHLIRKSDGKAWLISRNGLGPNTEFRYKFTEDEKHSYFYFIETIARNQSEAIALQLEHGKVEIIRKVLGKASHFEQFGIVGSQNLLLSSSQGEAYWISDIFTNLKVNDIANSDLSIQNMIFISNRTYYRKDRKLYRLYSFTEKTEVSNDASDFLYWAGELGRYDMISSESRTFIIDPKSDQVIKSIPGKGEIFNAAQQWGDGSYFLAYDSGFLCLTLPDTKEIATMGCAKASDLKIASEILSVEPISSSQLAIYSKSDLLETTQKSVIGVETGVLKLKAAETLEAYKPESSILVPVSGSDHPLQ